MNSPTPKWDPMGVNPRPCNASPPGTKHDFLQDFTRLGAEVVEPRLEAQLPAVEMHGGQLCGGHVHHVDVPQGDGAR